MNSTYTIPACNFEKLENRIKRLNDKLAKMGSDPISVAVVGETTQNRRNVIGSVFEQKYFQIEVRGEVPSMKGWELIASIRPVSDQPNAELIVNELPGRPCPVNYRTADIQWCDHCKTRRKRNSVYVMRFGDQYTQIGRSCIKEFVGGNPDTMIKKAETIWSVDQVCREATKERWQHETATHDTPFAVDIDEFVAVVAVVMRRIGWVPRAMRSGDTKTTADVAWELCTQPEITAQELAQEYVLVAEEQDSELAKKALTWARGLSQKEADSYLYNLGVVCRLNCVEVKNAGYVASVIKAYQKHHQEHTTTTHRHLGEVGKRQIFENLKVVSTREIEGQYLKTLVKFADPEGNMVTWWASGKPEWVSPGVVTTVKATVKSHKEFQGVPETIVQVVTPITEQTEEKDPIPF